MKLGLCLPQLSAYATPKSIRTFAERADQLGYDSLWAQEHLFFPNKPLDNQPGSGDAAFWPEYYRYVLAPFEILTFTAAITRQIRIGTSMAISAFHRPVSLAKQ